jgi:hypothetical protein
MASDPPEDPPAQSENTPKGPSPQRSKSPLEAPLIAVPDRHFRPPSPDAGLTPKPSSAPAPRMRPSAPRVAPEEIAPQPGAEAPATAADEIASMYAGGQAAFVTPASVAAAAASQRSADSPSDDPLFIRKTLIPILLTLGLILAGAGALLIFSGEDNALPDLFPSWTPMALLIVAALFVILGLVNMWAMRHRS